MKWKILFSVIFMVGLSFAKNEISQKAIYEVFGTPPSLHGPTQSTRSTYSPPTAPSSKSLDDLIRQVFPISPVTDQDSCTCVAYYLCSNGTILEDGVGLIDMRFGSCADYLETCCAPSSVRKERSPMKPSVRRGCGHRHSKGIDVRITGIFNNESQFGEFPWMVAVLRLDNNLNSPTDRKYHYQCGGSLIHLRVVLTAAHCLKGLTSEDLVVRAGEWDTQRANEPLPHQNRDVSRIIIHPKFNYGNLHYDYALLILSQPMVEAENVDVVCLPNTFEVFDTNNCIVSGWGKNSYAKDGEYQVILKRIDMPIVNHNLCQNSLRTTRLGPFYVLNESFICAGGEYGKDACKGDGGSPLVCPLRNDPERYLQAGIVSWGIGCGDTGLPGVYANVAHAREWIDQQLAAASLTL